MKKLSIILVLLVTSACTGQGVYENMQSRQRNECLLQEPPLRYEECMEPANQSYEEYERERQEILRKK